MTDSVSVSALMDLALAPQSTISIIGRRVSGKTTVAKEIMYHSFYEKNGI